VAAAPAPAAGSVVIIPRTSWTGAGPRLSNINPMRGVSRITVHHDGMNSFGSTSQADAARRLEQIRNAHLQKRAKSGERWADIGYHYAIDPAGRVWECRGVQFQGAHVEDQNEHNLGIVVLGNYNRQGMTSAAKATLDAMLATQMSRYNVPLSRVRTHQEMASTECPGQSLQSFMLETRSRVGHLRQSAQTMRLG
jgi:hypothetical protein